jgi:hypothetical protein
VKFKFAVVPAIELAVTLESVGAPVLTVTSRVGVTVLPKLSDSCDPRNVITPELKVPKLQPDVHGLLLPLPPLDVYEIPPLLDVTLRVVALVILSVEEDPRSSKVFRSKVTVGVKFVL